MRQRGTTAKHNCKNEGRLIFVELWFEASQSFTAGGPEDSSVTLSGGQVLGHRFVQRPNKQFLFLRTRAWLQSGK
eukprot:1011006-Amphidinium_carterae.1